MRDDLINDLAAEGADLDRTVADLPGEAWATPTPAAGWTVAHQIAHLAWTDRLALLAATDRQAFDQALKQAMTDPEGYVDAGAAEGAAEPPQQLLARWRLGRTALRDALAAQPDGARLPWFGPPMSVASMATARLMETWAHGLDVADAVGLSRKPTSRIRHVAHLGVRTRDFAFAVHGLPAPGEEFRVELTGPAEETWTWGPDGAKQRVSGSAYDFCLLVTQRRNRADLDLTAAGPDADRWLDIAQAFAGPPGPGRPPSNGRR